MLPQEGRFLKFQDDMLHYLEASFHFLRISGCGSISFFWMQQEKRLKG